MTTLEFIQTLQQAPSVAAATDFTGVLSALQETKRAAAEVQRACVEQKMFEDRPPVDMQLDMLAGSYNAIELEMQAATQSILRGLAHVKSLRQHLESAMTFVAEQDAKS